MKNALHKRWWFIGLCLLVSIVAFRHVWLWLPEQRYSRMIQQYALRAALEKDSPEALKAVAGNQGYEYQIFRNGRLQESSTPHLPHLRLLPPPTRAPGVLATSLSEQLAAVKPYEYSRGLHRYIFFSTTAGAYTYVIYGKVF